MPRYEFLVTPLQRIVRVYDTEAGQSPEGKTPYCNGFLLTDIGMRECTLNLMQGHLTDGMIRQIIALARGLGFIQAQFEIPKGFPATRFGKRVGTELGLDRYIVDLTQEI